MGLIKKIKAIFALAKPNWWYFTIQMVANTLHLLCKVVEPVFTANVITSLTVGDYRNAYIFLTLDIIQVIVRNLFNQINYVFYKKNYNVQYMQMQNVFIDKVANASTSNFNDVPKEALINMVVKNFYAVGNFCDLFISRLGKLLQVVASVVVVFTTNVWIGLAILVMGVIDYTILVKVNKSIANAQKNIFEENDKLGNQLANIIDNKEVIKERGDMPKLKQRYLRQASKYCEAEGRDTMLNGFKSNIFFVIYKLMIFAITCVLIHLVSDGALTLTLYLIVTPYLLTCTELLNDIFNLTYNVEHAMVSVNRINTVLNFTEDEFIKFGKIKADLGDKNLSLIDIKYKHNEAGSIYNGTLHGVDISFKHNAFNIIRGPKHCGKRIVYYTLARKIKPENGVTLLDNIDIYEYDEKSYRDHVFYTHTKPIFLNGSIIKNFKVATNDRRKIEDACRKLGIYDYIKSLPKGFDSNIQTSFIPDDILYLIGFARTIAKDSSIWLVYDLPNCLSKEQRANIISILKEKSQDHTIVYFTATNETDNLADVLYVMEYGKVKNVIIK